ncbi:hypothetical protein OSTOST_13041 [Ostertagia ostertagi]
MSLFNIGAAEEGVAAKSLDTTQKETLASKMSVEQEQDVLTAILAASDKETLRTRPKTPCPISSSRFPPRSASLLEEAALKGSFLKASDKKARKHIWVDKQDSPKSSRGIVITPRRTEEESGEKSIYTAVSSAGQSSASSKSDRKERLMPEIHPVYGEQQGHPTKDVVFTPPDSDSNRVRSEVMTATGRRERVCEEITSSPLKKRKEMPELKILPVSNHREQVGQCTAPVLPATKQDEIKADNEGETRVELPEKATETKVAAPQETDKAALEQLIQKSLLIPKKVQQKQQVHSAVLVDKAKERLVQEITSSSHSTTDSRTEPEVLGPKKEVVTSGPKTDQATQKIEELDLNRQQQAQGSVLVPGKIEERQQSQHSVLFNEEKPPSVGELLSSLQNNIESKTEPEVLGASCAQESEHLVTARPLLMKKVSKAAPIAQIVPAVPQVKTEPGISLEQPTQMSALVPGKVNETRQDQRAVLVSKEREQSVKEMSSSSHSSLDSRGQESALLGRGELSQTARGAEEIQQENLIEEAVPMATTPRTPHQRIVITPTSGEEMREQGQLGFVSQNSISAMSVSGTPQRFVGESPAVSDRQTQSVHVAVETPKSRVGHEPFLISDSSEHQHESDLVAVNSHREKWYQSAKGTPRTGSEQEVSTPKSRRAEDSQKVVGAESPYPKSAEHSEGIRTAVENPSPKPAEFSLASIFPSLFGQGTSSDEGSAAPDAAASRPRPVAQRPSPFTYPEQPARPKDPRRDVTRFRSEYANKFTLGSRHTVDFFRGSYDDVQREARSAVKLIVVFIHDPSLEVGVHSVHFRAIRLLYT